MNMNYTKITGFILSLVMLPVVAFADNNTDTLNPECTIRMAKVEAVLDEAHANKQFLMVKINKANPYNQNDETCNVNFNVELKDKKGVDELVGKFQSYMHEKTQAEFNNPAIKY
ncbi:MULTISPECIES: hypothetical protein [Pseudomonas]|uniref:hypothetical protein n=1 Tax=Pseudomonas TaxID=286 RepID=UPI000FC41D32|nr:MULTISPECIES: hypothetical protein [Pseudomonas]RUE17030.1 hypothetical protein IPC1222_25300 [Pseudomonas aeruginosa]CAH0136227.1 hypothetical protein SRABI111_00345 [Pseudomonas carnis]CAH0139195.1 hypothetical protein SRABI110_00489 [Pseudomonas carnis]CAH0157830.1 hypothetical protein SRABI64_00703 [Pseudomonas carnis]CAH0202321.1 hypothetical protein SRABI08_01923 [Pseudomonas carnis]